MYVHVPSHAYSFKNKALNLSYDYNNSVHVLRIMYKTCFIKYACMCTVCMIICTCTCIILGHEIPGLLHMHSLYMCKGSSPN